MNIPTRQIVSGPLSLLSDGVIKLLGIAEAHGVSFGFRKLCSFFSGTDSVVSVKIGS
ncbi:hypothetical protein G9A89_002498 [Geosiphon pyriformis]|nr:hypothetical protein G9A89_002498 [Geosiphon pyriformis]